MTILREHRRRIVGEPLAAEPAAVPTQPNALPKQAEDVTEAVRVAENGSEKEDVRRVSVRLLLPLLGEQLRILPKRLEDACIQRDTAVRPETLQKIFSLEQLLIANGADLEIDLRQIDLGERKAAAILLDLAREPVSVCRPAPEAPFFADELLGVERLGAVDREEPRFAHDDLRTIVDEGGDFRFTRMLNDPLGGLRIHTAPVDVVGESLNEIVRLTDSDRLTHDVLLCFRLPFSRTMR